MKNRIFSIAVLFGMLFTVNLTAQDLMEGRRVFIDPGHSGLWNNIATIPFNQGNASGFSEAHANLERALELQRLLEAQGATVGLSRTNNVNDPSLAARRDGANAFNATVYMSIHSNAIGTNPMASVNHPLVLFHNSTRHANSERFALDVCWWLADNPVTSWDRNPVNRDNARGQSLGAINTSQMPAVLTEDSFHDYRPETHRFLSGTYNDMISFNLYRGILRFLNINHNNHPTGMIMGWVKNDTRSISAGFPVNGYRFLPARPRSHDEFWPINGATVELLQNDIVIDTYTVDNNWNGIFGFMDVAPGNYQIRISAEGYVTETQNVTVTAGNITAANQILALCDPADNDCVQLFPPLRLVIGTEAGAPFGTHVTTADVSVTPRLYLGIDENNDESDPLWDDPTISRLTSSSTSVATINAEGIITLRAAGTTLIRVVRSTDGATGEITLTVTGVAPITPLEILSHDPQDAQEESARPIVRIEFDRPLNQATIAGAITVTNECGRVIEGVPTYHAAANGRSVLHFMFNQDLVPQAVYTVTLAAGVEGTDGGELIDDYTFTFTARPRDNAVRMLEAFSAPIPVVGGSPVWRNGGQTAGLGTHSAAFDSNVQARQGSPGSLRMTYQWVEGASSGEWRFNNFNTVANSVAFTRNTHGYIQFYLFGDGSNSRFTPLIQRTSGATTFFGRPVVVDWVGWRLVTWDLSLTQGLTYPFLGGSGAIPTTDQMRLICLYPQSAQPMPAGGPPSSSIWVSEIQAVGLGSFITRPVHILTFSVINEENGTLVATNVDGSVTKTSGEQVLHDRNVVFSAFPDEGFQVKAWFVNDVEVPNETGNIFTLVSLTANTEVTVEFEFDISVGLESIFGSNVSVFPNPFTNVLHITGAENSVLQVTNVLGAVVHTQRIAGADESINLGELSAGVYFFRLERDGQTKTVTVVKR